MLIIFIKSILSVFYLYIILIFIILMLYKLFLLSPLILNILLMLLLLFGIIIDQRFNWFRKSIFVLLIILQILVYKYLGLVPILILIDLFWYSVVLNISFIWHNLLLIWLYDWFKIHKNDYMCYIISRIDLLTSLSIINIFLSSLLLMVEKYIEYYCIVNNIGFGKKPFILELISTLLVILYKTNSYFIKFFSIYSLLIMGKIKANLEFNLEFFKKILFFVLFLILSFILATPRIYLIWIYYMIYDTLFKLINIVPFWFKYKKIVKNLTFLGELNSAYLNDLSKDSFTVYWKLMDHDIYYDYYGFLESCNWLSIGFGGDSYDIKDVLSLFIYDSNYRLFLYVKHISYKEDNFSPCFSDIELQNIINIYNINCTLDVYYEIYEKFRDNDEFELICLEVKGWNFFKYMIGLPKGRYYLENLSYS